MNAETGAGAIRTMLGMIGEEGATDHNIARLLVSNEQAIRAFLQERDAVTAEIEDWRGRLATQCGETLAARYQRDAATREVEALREEVGRLRTSNARNLAVLQSVAEFEQRRLKREHEESAAPPSADDVEITDHRFDGGSFGGGDQGICALCAKDARLHKNPFVDGVQSAAQAGAPTKKCADTTVGESSSTSSADDMARARDEAWRLMVEMRGCELVLCVPTSPCACRDAIAAALTAAHARGFHAAYARYEKDHRDLVKIMYRERESAKRAEYARGRAEMRELCLREISDVSRRAAEQAQLKPSQMASAPSAEQWKERQWYLHGRRHAATDINRAVRALPDAAPSTGSAGE